MFNMDNMGLYILIFTAKVAENALGTLRLIVVANGKKMMGAFLNFVIVFIWAAVAGTVLVGINEDLFKIFVYAFGSAVGSWLGSYMEEKIAMGSNMIMAIVKKEKASDLSKILREKQYAVTTMDASGMDEDKKILMVVSKRKSRRSIINAIMNYDDNVMIITEPVNEISGGHLR